MLKKMILFAAVVGLVLALAPAAQATVITVLNPSFESPDRGGDTNDNPDNWTVTEPTSEGVMLRQSSAAPTHGIQIAYFDDRSPWGGANHTHMSQGIGTGVTVAAYPELTLTFDARKGHTGGENGDGPANLFEAYFTVNGSKTGTAFSTYCGAASQLRKYADIQADTGLNMDTFTASMDATGLGAGDAIAIEFFYSWDDDAFGSSPRVAVDSVRVDGVPEPATMALLAFGGLGVLLRRKRR